MTIRNRVEKLEQRHGVTSGITYFAIQKDGINYEIGGKLLPLPEIQARCKVNDLLFIVDRDTESIEYGGKQVKKVIGVSFGDL